MATICSNTCYCNRIALPNVTLLNFQAQHAICEKKASEFFKKGIIMQAHQNDFLRGILWMVAGVALLLHTLGFMQKSITTILVIISLYLIISGAYRAGLVDMVRKYLAKKD